MTMQEIAHELQPDQFLNIIQMKRKIEKLIRLNRSRGETDNITAVLIKAY